MARMRATANQRSCRYDENGARRFGGLTGVLKWCAFLDSQLMTAYEGLGVARWPGTRHVGCPSN